MRSDKEYRDRIERYLDGEMEDNELLEFKKQVEINQELKEELEFYKMANSFVIENKISSVKNLIANEEKEYIQRKKVQKIRTTVLAIIGATIIIGAVYLWQSGKPNKVTSSIHPNEINGDSNNVNPTEPKDISIIIESPSEKNLDALTNKKEVQPKGPKFVGIDTIKNTSATSKKDIVANPDKKTDLNNFASPTTSPDKGTDSKPDAAPKHTSICDDVHIIAKTQIHGTCVGQTQGEIHVTNVKGGSSPYSYELSGLDQNSDGVFTNLDIGVYKLSITDKNSCVKIFENLKVTEKACRLDLYMELSSQNPIIFPVYEKAGSLSIFDKKGILIYSANIGRNERLEWNGLANGGILQAGYYPFIIRFEDGTIQNGSITVTP